MTALPIGGPRVPSMHRRWVLLVFLPLRDSEFLSGLAPERVPPGRRVIASQFSRVPQIAVNASRI